MFNFTSGNFPTVLAAAICPFAASDASEGLTANLSEVAAWKILHFGSCHLGNFHLESHPLVNAFGRVPDTKENSKGIFFIYFFILSLWFNNNYKSYSNNKVKYTKV